MDPAKALLFGQLESAGTVTRGVLDLNSLPTRAPDARDLPRGVVFPYKPFPTVTGGSLTVAPTTSGDQELASELRITLRIPAAV